MAHYKEAAWISTGRGQGGVPAPMPSVQYSQGIRPPGHMAAFFRIRGQASHGITNTADNTMVFVVMGLLNCLQFMTTRGDNIYIPTNSIYDLVKMGRVQAELFNF